MVTLSGVRERVTLSLGVPAETHRAGGGIQSDRAGVAAGRGTSGQEQRYYMESFSFCRNSIAGRCKNQIQRFIQKLHGHARREERKVTIMPEEPR